jgi:hypothetical protein
VDTTQRTPKPAKPISEKTRAEDEKLRKRLENISDEDMKEFDKMLEQTIRPGKEGHGK